MAIPMRRTFNKSNVFIGIMPDLGIPIFKLQQEPPSSSHE
ncbi:MAG: hypothetical protein ACI9X4_000001 [Glaciecola sp.]|jgi:hypothetical protein